MAEQTATLDRTIRFRDTLLAIARGVLQHSLGLVWVVLPLLPAIGAVISWVAGI